MSNKLSSEEIARYQTKLAIAVAILTISVTILLGDINQKIVFESIRGFMKESLIMGIVFCAFYILIVAFQFTNDNYHDRPRRIFTQNFEEALYFLIVSLAFLYAFVLFLTLSMFKNGIRIVLFVLFIFCASFIASKSDKIAQYLKRRKKQ